MLSEQTRVMLCGPEAGSSVSCVSWLWLCPRLCSLCCVLQPQQPLGDLDAQLRRTLSPETVVLTSAVGVSSDKISPQP